jgi:branched-chain amino acid transport system permease protein
VLSSFFAGFAGALASAYQEFVATSFIHLDKGADVLIMTFVGGSATFWGPILGVCFLTYFNDLLSSVTQHWRMVQGVMFIILVIYAPQGISGLLLQVKERVKELAGIGKGIRTHVEGVDQ